MKAKEWITFGSVIVIIIGWFINGELNRKHEMFKLRTDYRLEMIDSYVSYAVILEKCFDPKNKRDLDLLAKELITKLYDAEVKFLLYGTQEEVDLINEIHLHAQNNQNMEMKNKSATLMRLIADSLRSHLGLKKIQISDRDRVPHR